MATSLSSLPNSLAVCTNIAAPHQDEQPCGLTNAQLVECIMAACRSSTHTQPLPSETKDIKKALTRLDTFHSSQLSTFLFGYGYPNEVIPDQVLSAIRKLCINADSDWAYRCQSIAFELYCNELQARGNNQVPRPKPDDPVCLPQLRQTLPVMKRVPSVSVKRCHFKFVGTFSNDASVNERIFQANVTVENKGQYPFLLEISQTQTVIDGVPVENRFIQTTLEKQDIGRGESVTLKLSITEAPRSGFTEFEQVIVLTIDGILKYFVTFAVISPRQNLFKQRFPACLPLVVNNSPLGGYSAPIMLQIFKHVFIKQKGLSSSTAMRLMLDKSINYRSPNQDVMQEVLRAHDILKEQLNLSTVLESYWSSQADVKEARRFQPPPSSAQPVGYLPGIDLPTGNTSSSSSSTLPAFPSATTRLPDYLTKAPPEVVMGLILLWLSNMQVNIFDSYESTDPIAYLETMPPHLRGIVLWVLDLCCALLQNRAVNGATERGLALTFASILARRDAAVDEHSTDMNDNNSMSFTTSPSSVVRAVAQQQGIVTALLYWIRIYNVRFERAL